jgi:hypothetical protein
VYRWGGGAVITTAEDGIRSTTGQAEVIRAVAVDQIVGAMEALREAVAMEMEVVMATETDTDLETLMGLRQVGSHHLFQVNQASGWGCPLRRHQLMFMHPAVVAMTEEEDTVATTAIKEAMAREATVVKVGDTAAVDTVVKEVAMEMIVMVHHLGHLGHLDMEGIKTAVPQAKMGASMIADRTGTVEDIAAIVGIDRTRILCGCAQALNPPLLVRDRTCIAMDSRYNPRRGATMKCMD